MIRKFLVNVLLICSVFLLFNCGTGGSDAPAGSTITINPVDPTYTALSGNTFKNFSVVVKNANGIPLNNVDLTISGGFAVPRVPARYQFHESWNHDDPVISSFSARTNQEGVYEFSILIYAIVGGVASEFVDTISVRSATVSGSTTVTVGSTS